MTETLVVIPARGGSKGIPKKNLRPLANRPLIAYAIDAARACLSGRATVVVSTEDEEIAYFAGRLGADVVLRPPELSGDEVTLDPVVADATRRAETERGTRFDTVVTLQCTSPLVLPEDLTEAARRITDDEADTVISVVEQTGLTWHIENGRPAPSYEARKNRQHLPKEYRETGAIMAARRSQITDTSRIAGRISLLEQPRERAVDIDRYEDWWVAERLLRRRRVTFVVIGNRALGLGHVQRALALAHELVHHEVRFVCVAASEMAAEVVANHHYPVTIATPDALADRVLEIQPHLVINDILDTDPAYIDELVDAGARVANFEDVGEGAARAHLVVNALYDALDLPHAVSGIAYACLRDEFIRLPRCDTDFRREPSELLITFGGTDEGNLSVRALLATAPIAAKHGVHITVVTGGGYAHRDELDEAVRNLGEAHVEVAHATKRISMFMARADLAICSAGRTTLELASLGVPTVVVCQNDRETRHAFATEEHGFINLGHHRNVDEAMVTRAVDELLSRPERRLELATRMRALPVHDGKAKVLALLTGLIDNA